MKLIAYGIIILFISIIVLITIAIIFFSLDPNIKYFKYTEEELSEILKESLENDLHKKSKHIYQQMDLRECQMEESKKTMNMYLKKYNLL